MRFRLACDFPAWDFNNACSCLASIGTATDRSSIITRTASASTTIHTRTVTSRVRKSAVPTFQLQVVVPGKPAAGGGRFAPGSRVVKDVSLKDARVLQYRKANAAPPGSNVSAHVSSPDRKLFVLSQERQNLKAYGIVTLQAGIKVLGERGSGTGEGDPAAQLYGCTVDVCRPERGYALRGMRMHTIP